MLPLSTLMRLSRLGNDVHNVFWRIATADDRVCELSECINALQTKLARLRGSSMKSTAKKPQPKLTTTKSAAGCDYVPDLISPEGAEYRKKTYELPTAGGSEMLVNNPSIDEVRAALRANHASTVLEVGCGWGGVISQLADEFEVAGCDVSRDMLSLCPRDLAVHPCDITQHCDGFVMQNIMKWDVVFTRRVMLQITEHPLRMCYAMNSLMLMANKRIIIWERPEVCERMRHFSSSFKFEYHHIEHRSE